MSGGEVVQFPPRAHADHPGIFWAGDRDEAWCSACGQPGATNGEQGAWHRYAVHMVECPDREAPWIWVGSACDWGECDEASVGIRFDPESNRYLPVCAQHSDGSPS